MNKQKTKDLVLVVDDSPDSLGMINDALDCAGLTVLVALEGRQAISITNSITPDIILMDAIMPGMDGFETCRLLKAQPHLAHIPIIFMTGLSDTQSIVKSFDAGSVDYIQKPVNTDELIARMRVHLNNSRLTQSARLALDSAGQFLLTTNKLGEFKWATPQTYQLFTSAGLSENWLKDNLSNHIKPLFSIEFNKGKGVVISEGIKPVEIKYISEGKNDEYLLRLIDLEKPNEQQIFQDNFDLTTRESDVLVWLSHGKSNADIAVILNISPRTINTHLIQIFRKLNVENRTSAAVLALKKLDNIQSKA